MVVGSGFMHAAITMVRMKPKNQHEPMAIIMPYGTARVALAASSDMCTHESNPPIVLSNVSTFLVCRLLFHSPDRRQPRNHESPSCWPGGKVFSLRKDEVAVIAMFLANRQGDDSRKDEDEVHDHEDGLQLAHDLGQSGSHECMRGDCAKEDSVDDSICGCPIAVASDDDNGEEHQGEPI